MISFTSVPQKPSQITATDITAKTLTLSWNVSDPSPGKTTYTIFVYESTDDKGTKYILNQTLKTTGMYKIPVQLKSLLDMFQDQLSTFLCATLISSRRGVILLSTIYRMLYYIYCPNKGLHPYLHQTMKRAI